MYLYYISVYASLQVTVIVIYNLNVGTWRDKKYADNLPGTVWHLSELSGYLKIIAWWTFLGWSCAGDHKKFNLEPLFLFQYEKHVSHREAKTLS